MKQYILWLCKHLHKIYNPDTVLRVGLYLIYIKDVNSKYTVSKRHVYFENENIIVLAGYPKKFLIDDVDFTELSYQTTSYMNWYNNVKDKIVFSNDDLFVDGTKITVFDVKNG